MSARIPASDAGERSTESTEKSMGGQTNNPKSNVQAALSWHEQSTSKRRSRVGLSLLRYLLISLSALVFAVVGLTSLLIGDESQDQMRASLEGRVRSNSLLFASAVGPMLKSNNLSGLGELVAQLKTSDGSRAFVLDAFGEPVTIPGVAGPDVNWLAARADDMQLVRVDGEEFLATRAAVDSDDANAAAQVIFATPTTPLLTWAETSQSLLTFSGGLAILCIVPMAFLMLRGTTRPARELATQMKRVIETRGQWHVMSTCGGPYGVLADMINELIVWTTNHEKTVNATASGLQSQVQDLQAKIEARTTQLEQANQRLSGEIAEKEDFVRAVSHDLNAPLRNIGGMVQMMLLKNRQTLSEDVIQRLERIKKNVDVETDLINELLDLSRIKSKKQKLEQIEVESMVWDIRGLFENDLKTRNIELMIDTVMPTVWMERPRIRQVLQNLIDNAIKYMGDRPVREIHVGCVKRDTEIEFYVRDTGTGIHADEVDKVFYIFRRGRSETTQKVPGKGVGLASVKSIIETYSGKIWVTSQLNEGTTFYFTINGKYVPSMSGLTIQDYQKMAEDTDGMKQAA
jgi:signal transduction histidine kinase